MNKYSKKDFICKCGCGRGQFDQRLYDFLLELDRIGVEVKKISSAFRCDVHNNAVGGVPNSKHVYGLAVDIHVSKDSATFEKIKSALDKFGLRALPYPWGYHVDTGKIPGSCFDVLPFID